MGSTLLRSSQSRASAQEKVQARQAEEDTVLAAALAEAELEHQQILARTKAHYEAIVKGLTEGPEGSQTGGSSRGASVVRAHGGSVSSTGRGTHQGIVAQGFPGHLATSAQSGKRPRRSRSRSRSSSPGSSSGGGSPPSKRRSSKTVSLTDKYFSKPEQLWLAPVRISPPSVYGPLVVASALPKYVGNFKDELTIVEWITTVSRLFFSIAGVPIEHSLSIVAQCFPQSSPAQVFVSDLVQSHPGLEFEDLVEGLLKEYMGPHVVEKHKVLLNKAAQGSQQSVEDFSTVHASLWARVHPKPDRARQLMDLAFRLNREGRSDYQEWELMRMRSSKPLTLPSFLAFVQRKSRTREAKAQTGTTGPGAGAKAGAGVPTVLAIANLKHPQTHSQGQFGGVAKSAKGARRDTRVGGRSDFPDQGTKFKGMARPPRNFDPPNCRSCGGPGHTAYADCPARRLLCQACKEQGHFQGSPRCHLYVVKGSSGPRGKPYDR